MPNLVARFVTDNPESEVKLTEGAQDVLRQRIDDKTLDLVLTYEEGLGNGLEKVPLASVAPYVLLPAAHPLLGKPAIALSDLAEEPMILLDIAPSRSYFIGLFRDAGYEPKIRFRSPSLESVRGMVGHGLGYALLATKPSNNMTYDGRALAVRPLADEVTPSQIVVAWPAETEISPPAGRFVESCKAVFAELGAAT